MAAATYDFEIEQGATRIVPLVWKDSSGNPVNLTGASARMQVRRSAADTEVLLEMSTSNSRISVAALEGKINLIFSASVTAALKWRRGQYDLEVTSGDGSVTRLMQGEITVSPEITRD